MFALPRFTSGRSSGKVARAPQIAVVRPSQVCHGLWEEGRGVVCGLVSASSLRHGTTMVQCRGLRGCGGLNQNRERHANSKVARNVRDVELRCSSEIVIQYRFAALFFKSQVLYLVRIVLMRCNAPPIIRVCRTLRGRRMLAVFSVRLEDVYRQASVRYRPMMRIRGILIRPDWQRGKQIDGSIT